MKQAEHRPWTDQERAMLRRMRRDGVYLNDIAIALNRSRGSIQRQVRYLQLQSVSQRDAQRAKEGKGKEKLPQAHRAGRTTLPPLPSLTDET